MLTRIEVGESPFSLAAEYEALAGLSKAGAVVSFIGRMRDINEGDEVVGLHLEHYPGMTQKVLSELVAEAATRWCLEAVTLIHRVGDFAPCDEIVLVQVASRHRGEAFAACEFLMDYLKTQAPFWKQEQLADGTRRWVAARHSDNQALDKWKIQ